MSWWEFSAEVFAQLYFCRYRVAYSQHITAAEDRCANSYLQGRKREVSYARHGQGVRGLEAQQGLGRVNASAEKRRETHEWYRVEWAQAPGCPAAWRWMNLHRGFGAYVFQSKTSSCTPLPSFHRKPWRKWHKRLKDLKPFVRETLTFILLRSGLGVTCISQLFAPWGVFSVLFSGLATISPAILF